ncbi:MAG: hypothetical protein AUG07_08700 [Acidobacteria bacterium 13_1_20CM_2_60_10]|nr:MAG: hypothetical protein AUG07_08700 [Acidobacteria bacterium 13_1_20CM_2_60_10]
MNMFSRRSLFTLAVEVLTFCVSLGAQVERAMIAGTARDPSGAVVPNVSITVKNVNTGVEFKTTTNEAGEYVAPNLIPGEYSVTASAQGFSTLVRSGIVLHVTDRLAVDLSLQVGAVTQQVVVTAAPPLLKSETSSVVTLISRRDVADLPLNGRTVFQLAPLSAGVNNAKPGTNANNVDIPDNARERQGLSVNGQRENANTYILDGVYNNQINQGLIAILPPLEAIQEFTLETSNFNPEIGRGGGVMNVTLKSGTNQFHGSAFDYLRNSALDARNFFDRSPTRRLPNFVRNQFGGTIGGPIRKDKTFFFFDYQGLRERKGETFVTSVPGPNIRNGNFQGTDRPIFDPNTTCGFGTNPACALDANGNPIITRQPFPNMMIDPSRFNSAALKVLNFYPQTNDPSGAILAEGQALFFSSASRQHNETSWDIRIDHRISNRDSLAGHYSSGDSHTVLPGAFSALPQFAPAVGGALGSGGAGFLNGLVDNPARSLGIQEIHNFSPRMINEFRAAYVRAGSDSVQLGFGNKYADLVGIPNVNVTDNNSGFPAISIGGLGLVGESPFFPLIEIENVFQLLDNVTFIRGAHTMKFGFDGKKIQRNFTQILGFPAGVFGFGTGFTNDPENPGTTGNTFADFLLGIPDNGSIIRNSGVEGLRTTEISAYWQDTWKATQKLTVNFGIRYDLFTPQVEAHDRETNFDLGTGKLLLPPGTGGSDSCYRHRSLVCTDYNNFAPRIGLAYRLGDKSAIRASYGVFYIGESQEGFQLTLNPPFVGGVSYLNTSAPLQITRTLDQGLPTSSPFLPIDDPAATLNVWPAKRPIGYTQQWSFGVERQLSPSVLLNVTYVGNASTHIRDQHNPNQPFLGANSSAQSRRPYFPVDPNVFDLTYVDQRGRANYHALQATLTKMFSHGVSFLTDFTWGHSIDVGSYQEGSKRQDERNLDAGRGTSSNDTRNRFVFSGIYELPFGRGKPFLTNASGPVNQTAGGWELAATTIIQSGFPFTVTGGAGWPNRTCTGNNPPGGRTVDHWFDPNCFPLPALVPDPVRGGLYTPFGNAGSDILTGPGIANLDFSLFKSFNIREKSRIEFRSEFFNILNHTQFLQPSAGVPSGAAGHIFSTRDSRQIQMVLKLIF